MSWQKTALQGLRFREDFSQLLTEAMETAPERIRNLLKNLPNLLQLDRKEIKILKKEKEPVLLLLYYSWLSLVGDNYQSLPADLQYPVLQSGLRASNAGAALALRMKEEEISMRFLYQKASILENLGRYSPAIQTLSKILPEFKILAAVNSVYAPLLGKVFTLLGTLFCRRQNFPKAQSMYNEALTLYKQLIQKDPEYEIEMTLTIYNLGNLFRHIRKYSKAEKAYKKALRKFEILAETNPVHKTNVALTLNNLGIVYWSTHRFSKAKKAYQRALKTLSKSSNQYYYYASMILGNLGNAYADTNNIEQAEAAYKRALKMKEALAEKNPEIYSIEVVKALSNLGNFYSDITRFSQAKRACVKALTILNSIPDEDIRPYRAELLTNLGAAHWNTHKFSEAEKAYKEALILYKRLGAQNPSVYSPDVAMALNNLGILYSNIQDYKRAGALLEETLHEYKKLAEKNPDMYTQDVAMTLNNLGTVYYHINHFSQAETAFAEALTIYKGMAEKSPDTYTPFVAMTSNNLGSLFRSANRFSDSEKMYVKTLALYRALAEKHPDAYNPDVAMTLTNLGTLYWSTRQVPQAEKAYKKALNLYETLAEQDPDTYSPDVAMTLNNLGALYTDAETFEKAEKVYKKALVLYRSLARKYPDVYAPDVAMTLNNLGASYRRHRRMEKAEKAFAESLQKYKTLAEKNPDAFELYETIALNNLGTLFLHTERRQQAKKAFERAATMAEKRNLWFLLAEIYDNLSSVSGEIEDAVIALELGILFSGEEKYKYAQKGRREQIYTRFLEIVDDPQKAVGILEALRDPNALCLQWDMTDLKSMREHRIPNIAELRNLSIPTRIPHTKISENVLFLYIQKMEDSVLFLTITDEEEILSRSTLACADFGQRLLINLRIQALGRVFNKDIQDIITKFYDLLHQWTCSLPSEVLTLLSEKDTIVFSPDAVFSNFPLEGLTIRGVPICFSKRVIRAASISQLQRIPITSPESSLIVGNPWPSTSERSLIYPNPFKIGPLTFLKNAEREAQALAEQLPDPKIHIRTDATADAFLKKLGEHSIIHFAGHGRMGRILFFSGPMTTFPPEFEPEEFSILRKAWRLKNKKSVYMMEEWDIVTDIDIAHISLKKGAFVFLSACETGQHTYAGGGHFQGLAQSFLRRGASNVVSALIPLHDFPARNFALHFYQVLQSGTSVATALQKTRIHMKKEYTAPVYWLPYIHYSSVP